MTKKSFNYSARRTEKDAIPLVKWQRLARPKQLGGLGLKYIHHFGGALIAKNPSQLKVFGSK